MPFDVQGRSRLGLSFYSLALESSRLPQRFIGRLRTARFGEQWIVMNGFEGLRVLALESRRAAEIAKLIATYGGQPTVAPSMREVPLESNRSWPLRQLCSAANLIWWYF